MCTHCAFGAVLSICGRLLYNVSHDLNIGKQILCQCENLSHLVSLYVYINSIIVTTKSVSVHYSLVAIKV